MTLARTHAVALRGLEGQVVEVQCDISAGLPGVYFTGLPDASVTESRDRLRAAVHNSGGSWPNQRITVALLPADVRKVGSRFDLAIGVAVLAASGQVPLLPVSQAAWIAELGLDGRLRPVSGVLPSVLAARAAGLRRVVVASANADEAALVGDMDVRCADHLSEVLGWLTGDGPAPAAVPLRDRRLDLEPDRPDLADVAGQQLAKRALEIAAAGGHHTYLVGTPGSGKTMLAERLAGLLPPLTDEESLEVTAVHSVAGFLGDPARLVRHAPLQAPHHTASVAALVGGGSHLARPGAISLSHCGVLFLDEAPEFATHALDALRQPLETGRVVLARGGGTVTYPARFQLVLAANPCACGKRERDCICAARIRRRYEQRLSGPLLDRIDLRVQVEPVPHADLFCPAVAPESTAVVAARVVAARGRTAARLAGTGWRLNAEVPGSVLRREPFLPPRKVTREAEEMLDRGTLSARGFDRVLRLAWTLADLDGSEAPNAAHLAEALVFRTGQAQSWAA